MRGESLGLGVVGDEAGQAGCGPKGKVLRARLRGHGALPHQEERTQSCL